MSLPSAESSHMRRALRWPLPTALLALTPKCLLCVLGYVALAMGAQVEICGGETRASTLSRFLAPYVAIATLGSTAKQPLARL